MKNKTVTLGRAPPHIFKICPVAQAISMGRTIRHYSATDSKVVRRR